ncbi:MAG: DNA polymerase I [Rickettsiales bacterium]|nr:DNA polymerase I [Rickettsiales bacterium]
MTALPARVHNKIVIVDGYSFVFRAYYSMPALSRPSDGTPVGAVYGFTSMMMRLLLDMKPSHIVVVFDSGTKNHRHRLFAQYKANRPPAPEDLIPQFPLVREAARALNIQVLEKDGYEADDIIATLARIARENKEEVVIVSSDKDLMQLVNDHIVMYDAMRSKVIGEEEVKEKFGVEPRLIGDLLALVGDAADNIPGAPGIGPKTATELLNCYGSLQKIIENVDNIKQTKRRESIVANIESIYLSRKLVALVEEVKLDISFDKLKTQNIIQEVLINFLQEQNFKSLIVRAEKEFRCYVGHVEAEKEIPLNESVIRVVQTLSDLEDLTKIIRFHGICSIYLQSNFKENIEIKTLADIYGISVFINAQNVFYIPLSEKRDMQITIDLFSQSESVQENNMIFSDFIKLILPVLQDVSVKKIFYNYKLFLWLLSDFSVKVSEADDIMTMSYSLGAGMSNGSFCELLTLYLNEAELLHDTSITKLRQAFESLSADDKKRYITKKAFDIYRIFEILSAKLIKDRCASLYYSVDKPLSSVVSKMEIDGIKIDVLKIKNLKDDLDKQLEKLSREIYDIAGTEFNIASTQQLSDVLFNKLDLKAGKKSKSGNYSTDVNILESLQIEGHQIADVLLEWRKLYKLKTTYTDSLLKEVDNNQRVHTKFSIAFTSTGRFSSVSPNLQNIPIKTEIGNKIRGAFVASSGYKLVSADYSQVELRILAEIANVPSLRKAFVDGMDVHTITASEVFGIKYDEVDGDLRRKAKIINFSIIYGVSSFGLARNLGMSLQKAKDLIDKYFKKYPEILQYMETTKAFARRYGYVETMMRRKCFIKNDSNGNGQTFLDRAAINAPIQGSNADIVRKVMVMLDNKILQHSQNKIRMILQVHDELLFEIQDSLVEQYVPLIKGIMEAKFLKVVPLVVDINISNNWIKN